MAKLPLWDSYDNAMLTSVSDCAKMVQRLYIDAHPNSKTPLASSIVVEYTFAMNCFLYHIISMYSVFGGGVGRSDVQRGPITSIMEVELQSFETSNHELWTELKKTTHDLSPPHYRHYCTCPEHCGVFTDMIVPSEFDQRYRM